MLDGAPSPSRLLRKFVAGADFLDVCWRLPCEGSCMSKWKVEGYDTFSRELYALGGEYESAGRSGKRRLEAAQGT